MTYLKRVEDVLGPDWDKQTEGQKLKEEGEAFKKKLNTQELFEDWKLKVWICVQYESFIIKEMLVVTACLLFKN